MVAARCHLDALLTASEKVGRELTRKYYLLYADVRQQAFEQLCRANPAVARHAILQCTQKLLDRILFCAFCKDRYLLPKDTIERAYQHRDPYNPNEPVIHEWKQKMAVYRQDFEDDLGREPNPLPTPARIVAWRTFIGRVVSPKSNVFSGPTVERIHERCTS